MEKDGTIKIMLMTAIVGLVVIAVSSFIISSAGSIALENPSATLANTTSDYVPLSGSDTGDIFEGGNITVSALVETLFEWGIILAIALSILFIVLGSIQYMTTDAVFEKKEGISKIQAAIAGLILALIAWLILNTINPDLLGTDILNTQNAPSSSSIIEGNNIANVSSPLIKR